MPTKKSATPVAFNLWKTQMAMTVKQYPECRLEAGEPVHVFLAGSETPKYCVCRETTLPTGKPVSV
jgi:hypothetical protein